MTSATPPADWQLPTGVDRGLWDYLHNRSLARGYDEALAGSSLFAEDERFVLQHCPTPGRLIDLGCGTGRLLLALAQRGYSLLGVDLSSEMLSVARDKAKAGGVAVDLLQANLAELDAVADGSFDYAACLFSTLGMVRGAEARRKVAGHIFRVLRPGGVFVLHVHNRWFNAFDPAGRKWLLSNLLGSVLGRTTAGDRCMPVHQGVAGLTLHLFTRGEALRLLENAGVRTIEVKALGLRTDGTLTRVGLWSRLRAYGYLIAATKPA